MAPALAFIQKGLHCLLHQHHETVASVLQEHMYRCRLIKTWNELSCHFLLFPATVTSFVLALLMWPWGGPAQGPGVDGNLNKQTGKDRPTFSWISSQNELNSIMELLV